MLRRVLQILCYVAVISIVASAADKPNFVWLISEDNSKHFLKLFDETGAETPNIAALAKQGVVFNRAFSNAPVCSVARSTLISGCYAPRIGTQYHRRSVMVPMPEGLRMFPAYLRDAGYYTTNRSKTDYNATPGKDVWDTSSNKAHWRNRADGQPFFHKQSYGNSHESSLHFSRKVMETKKPLTDPGSVFIPPYHPDTPTFRYTYASYHDRIKDIDAIVGGVVDDLKQDGLLEDTFVFYFGDHGGVLPRGKGYAYESGLHVPLVVRIPDNWKHLVDLELGTRNDAFVSFIDFGPTLLHLAGIDLPSGFDGTPFLGKSVDLSMRDHAFGYADRFDEKYDLVRTWRRGNFKYMRNYQPFNFDGLQNDYRYKMLAFAEWRELFKQGKLSAVQSQFFEPRDAEALYDLDVDPHETNNLAKNPKHEATLSELRSALTAHIKAMPDLSFYPESHFVDHGANSPVDFGQANKSAIEELIDIADLALLPFDQAQAGITKALDSSDPWHRYWGYITCASFGNTAEIFAEKAKKASKDSEPLVRVRAAEFLGLAGLGDPRPAIMSALRDSPSAVATNLILNSAVVLQDGKPGYQFTVSKADVNQSDRYIDARIAYLSGLEPPQRPRKKRQSKN